MVPYYLIGKEPFFMKRITEAQIRQVIREEIAGLLNEIKLDGNFFGTGSKNKIDILFEMKGLELINKLKNVRENDQNVPLELRYFKIGYEALNSKEMKEINETVVLRFSYNHAKLFNRGYKIELLSLSDARKKKSELFASYEFAQMRKVSLRRDRKDVEKYEQLLGISVPNPVGGVVDVTRPTQISTTDGKSGMDRFRDQLDAQLRGEPYGGLDKGVRENKKRKR
jgi:hypothetical protein